VRLIIISQHPSERLQRTARFRNLLAHGYEDPVPAMVYANLQCLGDIQEFVGEVAP